MMFRFRSTVYRFGLSCLVFEIQTILGTSVFVNMRSNSPAAAIADLPLPYLTWGGGHDGPSQNVFDHCAQTLRRRKLKLGDF